MFLAGSAFGEVGATSFLDKLLQCHLPARARRLCHGADYRNGGGGCKQEAFSCNSSRSSCPRGVPNSIGACVFAGTRGRLIHPAEVCRQLSRAVLRPWRAEDGPALARVRTVDCKYRGACHLPSSQIALNGNKSATDKEGQSHISKPIKMDICASFPTSSIRVIRAHPWSKS